MSAKIVPFDFKGLDIRTIVIGGEPWFIAMDICAALEVKNVSQACSKLDFRDINTVISNDGINLGAGNPNLVCVSESGLYDLVLNSRKPEAKSFRRWVTSEVLPSIRKTGSYTLKRQEPEPLPALRPAIERVESLYTSLAFFGIDPENPRFKQGLQDLVGDTLGLTSPALPASTEKWYGVAERAQQLGIPVGLVTKYRSPLGTRIKAVMPEGDRREEERLCNGTQRPIKIYRVSDQLDNAIQAYFAPMLAVAS